MKKTLLSVLFILFVSTNVYCEPSETIKHLMNDSVSMLDWGIFRLENTLESSVDEDIKKQIIKDLDITKYDYDKDFVCGSSVSYDFKLNQIIITYFVLLKTNVIKDIGNNKIKKTSQKIIDKIKLWKEFFPQLFTHNGFQRSNMTEDISKSFKENILDIMKVKVHFQMNSSNGDSKPLISECMINSDKIMYGY